MKKFIFLSILLPMLAVGQTAVEYYNRAMAEFSYNNSFGAMENINKAIVLKADYADALSYRGYFHHLSKEYDKAIADYLAADKLKHNVNGYFIACPYAVKGNTAEAFKWLEVSLSTAENKAVLSAIINDKDLTSLHGDPKWKELINKKWYTEYEMLMNEGNDKTNAKDLPGALIAWNKAIALDSKNDKAYGARAINHLYQGNFDKALTDLNEAIRLSPSNSSYFGNRAYVYKELKKNNEALLDYNKAIQLDPQNMVYADRAMVKFILNQKDPGVASDLKMYLDCYYKDDFNFYLLGNYYYGIDNMPEAIKALDKAISINNQQGGYYMKRGSAYFISKQNAKAIEDYSAAIQLNGKDGEAYYSRGTAKGESRDKVGACEDWRKAQDLGYADPNGYIRDICK
ncbi:MAG: tetratricopeptide repeat protein [Bacteroidetes bacterium]|nr:tetratricopeptide repeat protein [Bacteroidota bacterium]